MNVIGSLLADVASSQPHDQQINARRRVDQKSIQTIRFARIALARTHAHPYLKSHNIYRTLCVRVAEQKRNTNATQWYPPFAVVASRRNSQ